MGEILWFNELGYLSILSNRIKTQLGLFFIIFLTSLIFLLININLAQKFKWQASDLEKHHLFVFSSQLKLRLLLPIILGFCLSIALILVFSSEVAIKVWQENFSLPNIAPPLPSPFEINQAKEIFLEIYTHIGEAIATLIIILLLLLNSKISLKIFAIAISLVFGLVESGNWTKFLLFANLEPFNKVDPLFSKDISFYVFKLPIWELLDTWLGGVFIFASLSVTLTYLLSGNSLSQGKFPGFSTSQLRHVCALGGGTFLAISFHHWLEQNNLLFSTRGVTYGAGYTDIHVSLPLEIIMAILSLGIAIFFFFKSWQKPQKGSINPQQKKVRLTTFRDAFLRKQKEENQSTSQPTKILKKPPKKKITLSKYPALIPSKKLFYPWAVVLYLLVLMIGTSLGKGVQSLIVEPNELAKETPYLAHNIEYTRSGFGFSVEDLEEKTFDPDGELNAQDILENELTIDNIRLWDRRPLLQTNRQLQQLRLYYQFPDADIDRYTVTVKDQNNNTGESTTEKQQVIIAARELDYEAVPNSAKTWVNKHLVYTHGYGFTVSPVNLVDEGGLPYYFVKNIDDNRNKGIVNTGTESIKYNIPFENPRIYYGELTDNYIMTSTKVEELDFPSGEENVYNIYDGEGGIPMGSPLRRLLFSLYLKDWQTLFTNNFTPDTKVLFRRNIQDRIRAVAPFLHYDDNPYLVVADAGNPQQGEKNYLYWVIDAYTTSAKYPYSDSGRNKFNYIRNSVKVVVNAYNGHVDYYVADAKDPIIMSWQKIFPDLFKSLDEMPDNLKGHIRYPVDLFKSQSERLLTYHMNDVQVFYNREDQWEVPLEIYNNRQQPIDPYYLIMKLPFANQEEFILLHPYTPISRPNLIGWLAGRADDENYGKLLLYNFPKQKLIYGPNQVEALINQEPVISQQISLWNREGSRVIQGNLLVIPIEQSLLYVEPIYLEAEENSLPTLSRVIVVYDNQIVMAETLREAIDAIFSPNSLSQSPSSNPDFFNQDTPSTPIIREVEGIPLPLEESEGLQ